MNIFICTKCGAKNRVSGAVDVKKTYRCGRCGTKLPVIVLSGGVGVGNEGDMGAVAGPAEIDRKADAQISKPTAPVLTRTALVSWFKVRENQLIFSLVLVALLLHLFVIPYAHIFIFDEHYYVPEAWSIIIDRAILHPEHPSLAKLFIASGILVFGDNPWGWRIPSVVFGVAAIVLFYLICRRLATKRVALLATFFLVFESLTFIMSGIAMLDVFSLTFMLLAFLFYLRDRYLFSGISLALSAVCKLIGLLGVFVILADWLIQKKKRSARNVVLFLIALVIAFIMLLPVSDFLAGGQWINPIKRISQMGHISSGITFSNVSAEFRSYLSYPWTWILIPHGNEFTPQPDFKQMVNLILWIMIIPSMGYMFYEYIRRKTAVSLFALLWFAATYLIWIPLVFVTDRATYFYYFYPTVGAVCIGVSLIINRIWEFASKIVSTIQRRLIKSAVIAYCVLIVLVFLGTTPIMSEITSYFSVSS